MQGERSALEANLAEVQSKLSVVTAERDTAKAELSKFNKVAWAASTPGTNLLKPSAVKASQK